MLYLISIIAPVLSLMAIVSESWVFWLAPLIYIFIIIPLMDELIPISINSQKHKGSDFSIFLVTSFYLATWCFGIYFLRNTQGVELVAKAFALGLTGGTIGINSAHELGHRPQKIIQRYAKLLLSTVFYAHFFTEHNKGHHRHVSTPHDPASAKFNQSLYAFLPQTIIGSFKSALKIDQKEVLTYLALEFAILIACFFIAPSSALTFLISSLTAILLLEIVNYIEHYGLKRKMNDRGRFEKVNALHSWDSGHFYSNLHLFNLSLHSHHHAMASKKFYELELQEDSLKLPSGYPSMMLLSLIPPFWFKIMNPKVMKTRDMETREENV